MGKSKVGPVSLSKVFQILMPVSCFGIGLPGNYHPMSSFCRMDLVRGEGI